MFTWKELLALPLFVIPRKIFGMPRKTSYGWGHPVLKYGDDCRNGHNTFSITVDGGEKFGGCCHDIIREVWPEYSHLIKWHLCSDDGPLHYIANSLYWAKEKHLEHFRSTAIWPEATTEDMEASATNSEILKMRLPALMDEFAETMKATFSKNLESADVV